MDNYNLVLLGVIIAVFVFLVVLLTLPAKALKEKRRRARREESSTASPGPQSKDWQEVAQRMEKYVHNLRSETAELKHKEEIQLKQIEQLKNVNDKLKEKLKHHEEWLAKEQAAREKINKEFQESKTFVLTAESEREREYNSRIRMERDFEELKGEVDGLKDVKRDLSLKVSELEVQLKGYKEEYTRQKKINDELNKKNEEMSWVSQTEYEKLEKALAEKEKELERVRRDYMGP